MLKDPNFIKQFIEKEAQNPTTADPEEEKKEEVEMRAVNMDQKSMCK